MNEITKDIIKGEIEKAEKRLSAAKLLLSKDLIEDAANRIYYSLFYAAKAMLNAIGYDAKTHAGLISEFGSKIVKEKKADKKMGKILRKSFELRESADYYLNVVIEKDEVELLIKEAEYFIKEAKKFVNKNI
ncbi:MAG: HEPN domain-containing protein [Candidatus Aenigmatarchaeota archaeon]